MSEIHTETLPQRFKKVAASYPELPAILSKDENDVFQPISFKEFWRIVEKLAKGLSEIGVKFGDHVGIISDNRKEWILSDMAILALGAVDVPRGSDSTEDEIAYILDHSDSKITFLENKEQFNKIVSKRGVIKNLETIILYTDKDKISAPKGIDIYSFEEIKKIGEEKLNGKEGDFINKIIEQGDGEDEATIIYTSGTTGKPKGVVLTHKAFIFQIDRLKRHLDLKAGDKMLSVLPVWHSFERAVEYILLFRGLSIAYSKPIGAIMLPDMAKVQPQWLVSVPRIWEGVRAAIYRNIQKDKIIKQKLFHFFVAASSEFAYYRDKFLGRLPYFTRRIRVLDIVTAFIPFVLLSPLRGLGNLLVFSKIKAKLGGKFIAGISGGGALPSYVDSFFRAAGVLLLEGYGLTETAPVTNVRLQKSPVSDTVGPFLKDIEYKVIDKEGKKLPPGQKGTLCIRSPQVMKGYYKNPEATALVKKDGWLNTGDICIVTYKGELKIIGREKETIVLLGGENIEPVPIEDKLKESVMIEQIIIVGQDKKFLAALIVPNFDELKKLAEEKNISWVDISELCENPQIQGAYHEIIQSLVNVRTGFKPFELVFRFSILPNTFEIGDELTNTLKMRRNYIFDKYSKEIKKLFS